MRPRLYKTRLRTKPTEVRPAIGRASASGPHIAAQCRLANTPSANAVQLSIGVRHNDEFLIDEVFLVIDCPRNSHFPQAGNQLAGVNSLNPSLVRFERNHPVEIRCRRAVELDVAGHMSL